MTTYNPIDGFIVCEIDCYRRRETEPNWSQMAMSVPYEAISASQINLSDGRIWIVGGRLPPVTECNLVLLLCKTKSQQLINLYWVNKKISEFLQIRE